MAFAIVSWSIHWFLPNNSFIADRKFSIISSACDKSRSNHFEIYIFTIHIKPVRYFTKSIIIQLFFVLTYLMGIRVRIGQNNPCLSLKGTDKCKNRGSA